MNKTTSTVAYTCILILEKISLKTETKAKKEKMSKTTSTVGLYLTYTYTCSVQDHRACIKIYSTHFCIALWMVFCYLQLHLNREGTQQVGGPRTTRWRLKNHHIGSTQPELTDYSSKKVLHSWYCNTMHGMDSSYSISLLQKSI